jgi:uncharacterized protein (DUF1330 family)
MIPSYGKFKSKGEPKMSSHVIITLNVTDPTMFDAYHQKAREALAKHGGAVAQASRDAVQKIGAGKLAQIIVVVAFPSKDAAMGWLEDPELQEVHKLRNESCEQTLIVL